MLLWTVGHRLQPRPATGPGPRIVSEGYPTQLADPCIQSYAVMADTDIDEYVSKCTILRDGTKIYRFSKELLGCIEMFFFFVRTTGRTMRHGHVLQGCTP